MPIDFTLTPEQQRLRADARAFARDVLSKVGLATRDLPTPLARFAATRPFYEQTVGAGFLRRLIPAPLGGQGTGIVDMAVLAEEFHAVDVNISLTLLGTMLGLFPVLLGGRPEQAARFFAPFAVGAGRAARRLRLQRTGRQRQLRRPRPGRRRTHPGASGRRSLGNFGRKEVGLQRHRLGRERGRPADGGLPHRS